jgi:lipid-A-disaccharide synthase
MRLYLCAGEASGDRLGALLLEALRARIPNLTARGAPGPLLRAAGTVPVVEAEALTALGPLEAAAALPRVALALSRLEADARRWKPDVVVTIDSPSALLPLARRLRQRGLRTVHWVSPQVWAWRPHRVRRVAASVDTLMCLFPFEASWYANTGLEVVYTGHPLVDAVRVAAPSSMRRPVFGLAPGSRPGEIQRLWPIFRQVAGLLRARYPSCRFVVPVAPTVRGHAWTGIDATFTVGFVGEPVDAWLVCSGTATLEIAARREPMIVVYRTDPLTYVWGRSVLNVAHLALPNLIAGREIVPEYVQDLDAAELAAAMAGLLGEAGREQRRAVDEVIATLGSGAVERAADAVLRKVA